MRRFAFPLVALVLGVALVALSQLASNPEPTPSQTNGTVNANAFNENSTANSGSANTNTPAANTNATPTPANTNSTPTALPAKVSLEVPFTSQAPFGVWDPEYNDACEETSALMVVRYLKHQPIVGPEDADQEILAIERWETENIGYWESTTAVETERFIEGYWPGITAEVKPLSSMDQVKAELAVGNPVILPANGRELSNPNFRDPGPRYHMLVVTGYDSKGFITNDPGTRKGEDYRYSGATLLEATHDWQGHEVADGPKVYLVLGTKG